MAANWAAQDARLDSDTAMVERLNRRPTAKAIVELLGGSSIKPEPICWLWLGWLGLGKVHIFAGSPGTGKTTVTLDLAARVSSGRPFPDGSRAACGNVIIWSGEDDPADTLVPRLIAMGANMARIWFVGNVVTGGERTAFDPSRDVPKLLSAADALSDVSLVIIDPVVSAIAGDSNKTSDTRRGLQPLVDLAEKLNAAVIGISHYSKGTQGRDPTERVTGSIAFGAVARVVWGTVRQQTEEGQPARLILARTKSNIGPDSGGFVYAIEQVSIPEVPGLSASRIVWGEAVEGSARELLGEPDPGNDEPNDSAGFLRDLLECGPRPVKEVFAEASAAGYSRDAMHRAKRKIGATAVKRGMLSGWVWELPRREASAEDREGSGQKLPPSSLPSGHKPPPSKMADSAEDREGGGFLGSQPSADEPPSSDSQVEAFDL